MLAFLHILTRALHQDKKLHTSTPDPIERDLDDADLLAAWTFPYILTRVLHQQTQLHTSAPGPLGRDLDGAELLPARAFSRSGASFAP